MIWSEPAHVLPKTDEKLNVMLIEQDHIIL